jgi:cytochrome c-type biogenesis protein
MGNNISILAAFAAGILSFLSPCVFPLFGSYLAFISGSAAPQTGADSKRHFFSKQSLHIVVCTLFFIGGFTVIFSILSIVLYGFFLVMSGIGVILNIIAGAIVIILGLNILFGFIPFLKYDDSGDGCEMCALENTVLAARKGSVLHSSHKPQGFAGAFLAGVAFGAGWTPCVGAFLGSILLMASQSSTLSRAAMCLVAYSAGLGVPFLVVSFFWAYLLEKIHGYTRFLPLLKRASGIFLILAGLLMAAGRFSAFNRALAQAAYALYTWSQSGSPAVRILPAVLFGLCALVPLAVRLYQRKRKTALCWAAALVFLALAATSAAGLFNPAAFVSHWLTFSV